MRLASDSVLQPGEVPVLEELYLAIKDFNPEDKEPALTKDHL